MIGLTHRHKYITLYVVVDDTSRRTCKLCLKCLVLKCILTSANESDLALQFILGERSVICLHTNTGDRDVFKGLG